MEKHADAGSFLEKYLTPISVLVGACIIAAALAFGNGGGAQQAATNGQPPAQAVDIKKVDVKGDPYIGNPNAPVVMAYWFDYQCPFCKKFDQDTMGQIYENYVKTGKVKVVFQDFQFLGPDSDDGALFARAVWEAYPDQFYAWYQAMFEAQDEEHAGFGNTASIVTMTKAKVPAIDTTKVLALIEKNKDAYTKAITADRTEGGTMGVSGTPAMIIGKTLLSGAQPYSAVTALLDAELK
ncbi:MAG: thioredoxin domain-containing protein [Patescibacteria group bacterium]